MNRSLILTLCSIVAGLSIPALVAAETVGGIISTDTTWSNTSEPYTFSSAVQIRNGVTLTIESGVHLQSGSINVFGNLRIAGTTNAPVELSDVAIVPAGNGDPNKRFSMEIYNAHMSGGSLYYPTGNAIYGSLLLQDSILANIPYMYLWYPTSDILIKGNIFSNFGGISVGSDSANVLIENNLFNGSGQNGYLVQNWASYGTATTTVRYNSFLNSLDTAVMLPPGYGSAALDARYNYWGTVDTVAIAARIYDDNDDLSTAGSIPYLPFLTSAHPNTPAVPEPVTSILLLAGFAFVLATVRVKSRNSFS